MNKIGIVSGMGASAGAYLLRQLITACQKNGAACDADFPEIFLHSVQSEGLDKHGIADWWTLEMELGTSVARLNHCGADRIIIACNTAHVFWNMLQEYSHAEILNMVDIAVEGTQGKIVGVMSSATTREEKLYENALEKAGATCLHVHSYQQKILDDVIDHVIKGTNDRWDKEQLISIIDSLRSRGAKNVILGCTELPVVMSEHVFGDFVIDPGEKTVERAIS